MQGTIMKQFKKQKQHFLLFKLAGYMKNIYIDYIIPKPNSVMLLMNTQTWKLVYFIYLHSIM
jgi:hypothetical protein